MGGEVLGVDESAQVWAACFEAQTSWNGPRTSEEIWRDLKTSRYADDVGCLAQLTDNVGFADEGEFGHIAQDPPPERWSSSGSSDDSPSEPPHSPGRQELEDNGSMPGNVEPAGRS